MTVGGYTTVPSLPGTMAATGPAAYPATGYATAGSLPQATSMSEAPAAAPVYIDPAVTYAPIVDTPMISEAPVVGAPVVSETPVFVDPVLGDPIVTTPAVPPATTDATPPATPDDGSVTPSSKESGFFAAVGAMGRRLGSVAGDGLSLAGVQKGETGPELKFGNVATIATMNAGVAGAIALAKRGDVPGTVMPLGDTLTEMAKQAGSNAVRVTPTLVSAVAGPAVADGITYLAPNLVPKYKREMKPPEKTKVQVTRALIGGAAIGVAAAVAFLVKPDLFKKLGAQFISDEAIRGATHFVADGKPGMVYGIQTAKQIARDSGGALTAKSIEIVKEISPLVRDATFSNQVLLGGAGALGTLLLANKAAGEEGDGRRNWGIAAAVAGAATIGGVAAMGRMTESVGALQNTGFMFKPNFKWVKEYATKIAPITMIPAGTAAAQYFDIVSDFDDITAARSPFRR